MESFILEPQSLGKPLKMVLFGTNDQNLWTNPPHRFWEIWDLGQKTRLLT